MITKYKGKNTASQPENEKQRSGRKPKRGGRGKAKANTNTGNYGKLKVMCLGGLEEVGRNMTLLEYDNEIIIIDMGVMFPEEDMYGIDYIIPNIEYLKGKEDKVKGVIITHGHLDHIGAIPHLMGKIGNPPMFMGKMTAGLVRKRAEEHKDCPKLNIQEVTEKNKIQLGKNFRIEFMRINHSIPDSFAIIADTPAGRVMHTGDYKIDYNPVIDEPADLQQIAKVGARGIDLLMGDSTGATVPGYQKSEEIIRLEMQRFFAEQTGRLVIGTFASQISRMQIIFDIAEKIGRKVYLAGRSLVNNVEIAHQIGYLRFKKSILVQTDGELKRLPDDKVIILGTGAQGEENAFLMKVVQNEHRAVKLKPGDTVVFSSSAIPGNERSIQNLYDMVSRTGARIVNYKMLDVHAGGHANQEDIRLFLRLVKPANYMPIEANHFMLQANADLAKSVGVPNDKIFIADNGQVLELNKKGRQSIAKLTNEKVPTEFVMVDGLGVGDVSNIVLRDRKAMAEDGMIVVIATIDSKTGDIIGSPDIISRGFVYMKENKELIQSTRKKVKEIVKGRPDAGGIDEDYIKNKIRNDIGQFLYSQTKRRPMVLPVVIKV